MRSQAMLLVIAAAAALTPLPPGINAYEVAAGTRNRPAEALAPVALRAIAAAREANVKLGEIEFPALLGEKTAFDDVDNVVRLAIRNENRTAAEIDDMSNGDEVRKAREVLKAVRQFNLRKVASLLDVNVPQPPTWGGRSRNSTSEDPAVSLRRLVK